MEEKKNQRNKKKKKRGETWPFLERGDFSRNEKLVKNAQGNRGKGGESL